MSLEGRVQAFGGVVQLADGPAAAYLSVVLVQWKIEIFMYLAGSVSTAHHPKPRAVGGLHHHCERNATDCSSCLRSLPRINA